MDYRHTSQFLLPSENHTIGTGSYDIYPSFNIGNGKIFKGLPSLASVLSEEKVILIDGYTGTFFDGFRDELDRSLRNLLGRDPVWISTSEFLKSEDEINALLEPFLGGDDPLFGRRSTASLSDYFRNAKLPVEFEDPGLFPVIIYGIGAAMFSQTALLVYIDLPKNELQYRARAGTVTNIGVGSPSEPKAMFKRFYFADWIALNRHKKEILNRISIFADGQRPGEITWMTGDDLRSGLDLMSRTVFRARPWFEPGTWGGSWIKNNIGGLSEDVPNYAWSFELITPENGLLLESSGLLVECSFDLLMYSSAENVLGDCYNRFGTEFPIRFDFLDTFDGGNLSVQVHPRPDFTKRHFGEDFTQEETYYILDTKNNASVYLGFAEGIEKDKFRKALEESYFQGKPVDMEAFVQVHPASKHDLFLIPYGTIHGSGKNNLVLEISSTPYIFTFKMYDWLRPDLDGIPRTLNIDRGMDNLYFDRCGKKVKDELISKPMLINEGDGWQLFHLPTHKTQLYDVHRYHIEKSVTIDTLNKCFVLSLVEGESIVINTRDGGKFNFSYAETFVIPAASGVVEIVNESEKIALLIAAFVK